MSAQKLFRSKPGRKSNEKTFARTGIKSNQNFLTSERFELEKNAVERAITEDINSRVQEVTRLEYLVPSKGGSQTTWEPINKLLVDLPTEDDNTKNEEQRLVDLRTENDVDDVEFYEAERILDKKIFDGVVKYLVKWVGWADSANTWEPIESFKESMILVQQFEEKLKSSSQSSIEQPAWTARDRDYESKYCVENIVGRRILNGDELEYCLKWKNYEKPTWEPLGNIKESCRHLIQKYEEQQLNEKCNSKTEPLRNYFEAEWEPQAILGATRQQGIHFLVKFQNKITGDYEVKFVPNRVARLRIPQMVIEFYLKHATWENEAKTIGL